MLHRGQQLVAAAEIDCQDVEERLGQLQGSWDTLREAAAGRLQRLREASEAQQYYLDAGEAEAWIGEQEFYVFSDENPQVGSGRVQGWEPKPAEKKSQRGDGLSGGAPGMPCVRSEGRGPGALRTPLLLRTYDARTSLRCPVCQLDLF